MQLKLLTVLTDDINDPISSDIMCYDGHQTHVEHINQATILTVCGTGHVSSNTAMLGVTLTPPILIS